jgi:phosphatidylglycerol lysyltransferase
LRAGHSQLAIVSTAQTETAMFDPICGAAVAGLPGLLDLARRRNKVALIYKTTPRVAATLRRAGMVTLHIADEAVIDPQEFHLEGRKFRQLRRKLR